MKNPPVIYRSTMFNRAVEEEFGTGPETVQRFDNLFTDAINRVLYNPKPGLHFEEVPDGEGGVYVLFFMVSNDGQPVLFDLGHRKKEDNAG